MPRLFLHVELGKKFPRHVKKKSGNETNQNHPLHRKHVAFYTQVLSPRRKCLSLDVRLPHTAGYTQLLYIYTGCVHTQGHFLFPSMSLVIFILSLVYMYE